MKIKTAFLSGLFCTALFAVSSFGAGLPRTAELAPADTLVLIDISDFNQLRTKFEKTNLYKLYKDPSMAVFSNKLIAKIKEKISSDKDSLVKNILDANIMPEGKTAFMITPGTNNREDTPVVFISQWGQSTERMKDVINKMTLKLVEKGARREFENYRDVNIVTLTTTKKAQPVPMSDFNMVTKPGPAFEKNVYCFAGDCLIFGDDVDAVKFVISRLKGTASSSLAGDADYISIMGAVGPYHDIDIYINIKQVIKSMADEDKSGETQTEMANLGFDGIRGIGISLGVATSAENSFYGKGFLKTAGTRKGVLKMLEMRSEALRAPRFIPGSACSLSFLNIDIKRAYDELCSIIYGFSPAGALAMQQPIPGTGSDTQQGLSIRPDIIEYLGSEIVFAQSINKPFSKDKEPAEIYIAIGVNNRAALEKSLSLIHKQLVPNNPEPTRELLGHTIYLLGPAGLPVFGGAVPMVETGSAAKTTPKGEKLAFTITDTHLIFGQEPAVERAIRTLSGAGNEPVNSSRWFNIAKNSVPSVVGMAGFEDNVATGELLWWMLKESGKSRRASMGMGPAAAVLAGPDAWDFADFGLLPEYNAVKKYFGLSASYGISRPDGYYFEFKYLNRQGKD